MSGHGFSRECVLILRCASCKKCGNNVQGLWFNNQISSLHVQIPEFARKSCHSGCWKINDSNYGALRPLARQISWLVNMEGSSRCWYKSVERVRKTALVIARSLPITPDLLVVELGGSQNIFSLYLSFILYSGASPRHSWQEVCIWKRIDWSLHLFHALLQFHRHS